MNSAIGSIPHLGRFFEYLRGMSNPPHTTTYHTKLALHLVGKVDETDETPNLVEARKSRLEGFLSDRQTELTEIMAALGHKSAVVSKSKMKAGDASITAFLYASEIKSMIKEVSDFGHQVVYHSVIPGSLVLWPVTQLAHLALDLIDDTNSLAILHACIQRPRAYRNVRRRNRYHGNLEAELGSIGLRWERTFHINESATTVPAIAQMLLPRSSPPSLTC